MTYEFEYLMHLFACGAKGTAPIAPTQSLDWNKLIKLANEQSILHTVSYALSKPSDISFPSELKSSLLSQMRQAAISSVIKKQSIMRLIHDFDTAGIRALLLKGYVVADLYAVPECRISGDTDIYVDKEHEKLACEFLEDHGCKVEPRSPKTHHAVCYHPQMGCIELHVILYDEIVEEVWFGKMDGQQFIKEPYERCESIDGVYYTLGKTDNLIFITLHMIKHFIIGGTSLRQLMDFALYFKSFKEQINIIRFWETIESLQYQELTNTLLSAMVMYCNFSADDFIGMKMVEKPTILAVLDDLEIGGWLGFNEKKVREDGWHEYNRIKYMTGKSKLSYKLYMIRWSAHGYIKSLFPTRAHLAKKFPYVEKNVMLVPVAWIQRLFVGLNRIKNGDIQTRIVNDEEKLSDISKNRITLFKRLNMI